MEIEKKLLIQLAKMCDAKKKDNTNNDQRL